MKEKVIAIVIFVLSVLFLYKTWYFIPSTADMMPNDFVKVLFWVGYVGIAISCTVIKPAQILISQDTENLVGMVKAVGVFFVGVFVMPMLDLVYTVIENIWAGFASYSDLFGFGYIVIGLCLFLLIPQYMIIGSVAMPKKLVEA
jgi:hypothetical protein